MLCVALITQKSRSPQITSRISSFSGRTIIVVYRSRVWSGIRLRGDADTSRIPVVWASADGVRLEATMQNTKDASELLTGHGLPPMHHEDAARRSIPASNPYCRNVSATRALSTGVFV